MLSLYLCNTVARLLFAQAATREEPSQTRCSSASSLRNAAQWKCASLLRRLVERHRYSQVKRHGNRSFLVQLAREGGSVPKEDARYGRRRAGDLERR